MGTQNLLNYYFNKLDAKISYSSYHDFYLASDEKNFNREVMYSKNIIGYDDGNVLPVWIDLNLSGVCTTQPTLTGVCSPVGTEGAQGSIKNVSTGTPQTILSKNYWPSAYTDCECPYTDATYTAIDTGVSGGTDDSINVVPNLISDGSLTQVTNIDGFTAVTSASSWTEWSFGGAYLGDFTDGGLQMANYYSYSGGDKTYLGYLPEIYPFPPPTMTGTTLSASVIGLPVLSATGAISTYTLISCKNGQGSFSAGTYGSNPAYTAVQVTLSGWSNVGTSCGDGADNMPATSGDPTPTSTTNATTPTVGWFTGTSLSAFTTFYTGSCSPPTTPGYFSIPNINLTGIDNGLLTTMTTGQTIQLYDSLSSTNEFDATKYDKRLKLNQVSASTFSLNNIAYTLSSATDNSGYYQELNGGFYQGFYKLHGYPYQILPDRPDIGWTVETFLKIRATGETTPDSASTCFSTIKNVCDSEPGVRYTLNDVFPNNAGFFYYVGTRAENKFHSEHKFETGCTSESFGNCCSETVPGHVIGPARVSTSPIDTATGGTANTMVFTSATEDAYSNCFGLRLTPDFKLGYRVLRYTGSCVTTGYTIDCTTGTTFDCGYDVEEKYSDVICPALINSGTCEDTWIHVAAVFDRDFPLLAGSSCDVEYNFGGLFDLTYIFPGVLNSNVAGRCKNVFDEMPLIPEDGYYDFDCSSISGQTVDNCCYSAGTSYGSWLSHDEYRRGSLTLYVNGRRVLKINDFEEIIPRPLNQHRDLQVGVPYNMSWGGGSQGLYETVTFGAEGCTGAPPYIQTAKDLGLLIENNFAGTFMGGISQLRYYTEPLYADAIYHNFLVNKDRYSLIDCDFQKNCTSNSCNNSQVLYLTEGDMFDIKAIFGTSADNLYFETNCCKPVKFRAYTQDNVSSVKFYKNGEEVTVPFYAKNMVNSTGSLNEGKDTIEIVITKMDNSKNAIVTLLGNTYK